MVNSMCRADLKRISAKVLEWDKISHEATQTDH